MNYGISPFPEAAPSGGSRFLFGCWPKEPDGSPEPVEWRILYRTEDELFLLAEYALDARPFGPEDTDVSWEDSTLRSWLGDGFLNAAFTPEERLRIIPHKTGIDYGNQIFSDIEDLAFIPSREEIEPFLAEGTPSWCRPTEYACAHGAFRTEILGTTFWWLRSMERRGFAPCVSQIGLYALHRPEAADVAVRPAIRIRIQGGQEALGE
ncbi:MAG: DUF6273 domain-containing protein [Mailhella sp.]|nr:DUF6273 domain-containing protein [Mailhella sp.]